MVRRSVVTVFVVVASLAACTGAAPPPDQPPEPTGPTAPDPTGSTPAGTCEQPLFPVVEGAAWTYLVDSEFGNSRYTDTVTDLAEDGFTITTTFPGLEKEARWSCGAEGIVALDFGGGPAASLTTGVSESTFQTRESTGVTFPASIEPGDTWTQSFEVAFEQSFGDYASGQAEGTVELRYKALVVDRVRVPAGSYDALEVQIDVSFDLVVSVAGQSVPLQLQIRGSSWFADGVGMVKNVSRSDIEGTLVASETVLVEVTGLSPGPAVSSRR